MYHWGLYHPLKSALDLSSPETISCTGADIPFDQGLGERMIDKHSKGGGNTI